MTEQSALANMGQFEWDSTESVSYEVAIEAISQAAAAIAPLIAIAREHGDETAVAELVSLRKQCIAARNELQPTDRQGVAEATQRYRALAEQLGRRAA
ncbi:hypothetical protein ACFY2R_30280 [Micromonospora olivasterospora]|uniref:Uncharacterized protein n=1 Tax=Micromonospora olivasterospora TaxID=1880 RepID=A0A562IJ20_MICOL|nr:hypothetical protein [Micromonospora olivasterospora]TWH71007.1 hypothetical protein JD77_06032 [Micromonospora olivasterospora]